MDKHSLEYNGNNLFCDSNDEHCYLNLPKDMVEDNPLDLENTKEKQDEDNDLHQSLTKHPTWYSRNTDNWVSLWLSHHSFSQYSPTGSTQFDVQGGTFTTTRPTCYVSEHTMVYVKGE